jgi:meiotically up-regulated gene 157 (Mug157) protein
MLDRRDMLGLIGGAGLASVTARAQAAPTPAGSGRPPPSDRRFTSPAVERAIISLRRRLNRPGLPAKLALMVENCLPNTLDTTVTFIDGARPDTFVITGDIPAMWLRDSSAQVWPYLRFCRDDPRLARLIAGVIHRQNRSILLDPYANAFNRELVPSGEWANDRTMMRPGVWERKWEVDSLCYPIRLAHGYWRTTGDTRPFDAEWREATRTIVSTFATEQRKAGESDYRFLRPGARSQDSVARDGRGAPARANGLIAGFFRPSDDVCQFPFLIPSNLFAVVSLRQLATMHAAFGDAATARAAAALANEVAAALVAHGQVDHPRHGRIWAYEIDGYGSRLLMDDANAPSLLSLSYLGAAAADEPLYRNTRRFALSTDNPWYVEGKAASGIGGPHISERNIWPMAIIMRALTSADPGEIEGAIRTIAATDADTGFIHESFDQDDAAKFTRPWFAWANTLFGELMLDVLAKRPALLDRF